MITKDNITIAALRLFLERGYKYVSLVDVANEVGITKGGIYHYFSSKEELLHIAVHFLFDHFEEKYTQLFSSSKSLQEALNDLIVEQKLENYAGDLLGIQGDYRVNHASFALEVMSKFPDIHERVDRSHLHFCNTIEKKIRTARAKEEIRNDLDIHSLAVMILSLLGGQQALSDHFKTPSIRKSLMDNIWRLISGS